ncbi:hypothetical protein [Maribacter sp. R86514]|uniref:RipA family octameric membrane protein n=1 Tax=Maribacter sp. R86514 TaxID=3093854 RepID=UPI0037CB0B0D
MKLKAKIQKLISPIFRKRYVYNILDDEMYFKSFGVEKDETGEYKAENNDLLEKAYQKAWDNRDFEINKFWTRAAYFWGFIVLIFGGLITLLTSKSNETAINLRLDLYLIALGLLFSIAWYLVMKGSKSWQENWEAHIDYLENFISGPLYKTVHYKGNRFYSVSKINELLALLVILVWLSFFIQYFSENFVVSLNLKLIDYQATLTFWITLGFASSMRFGYALGIYDAKKNGFIDRWS